MSRVKATLLAEPERSHVLSGFRFARRSEKPQKAGLFSTAKFTLTGHGFSRAKSEFAGLNIAWLNVIPDWLENGFLN